MIEYGKIIDILDIININLTFIVEFIPMLFREILLVDEWSKLYNYIILQSSKIFIFKLKLKLSVWFVWFPGAQLILNPDLLGTFNHCVKRACFIL